MTVSHQKIPAIHVICPSIMECNEPYCNHWALRQDTRTRDIPQVTLIKGIMMKYTQNHSPAIFAGVYRLLQQPGQNLECLPNPIQHDHHSHYGPPHQDWTLKNYFSPNHFYCVENLCAPCGITAFNEH